MTLKLTLKGVDEDGFGIYRITCDDPPPPPTNELEAFERGVQWCNLMKELSASQGWGWKPQTRDTAKIINGSVPEHLHDAYWRGYESIANQFERGFSA